MDSNLCSSIKSTTVPKSPAFLLNLSGAQVSMALNFSSFTSLSNSLNTGLLFEALTALWSIGLIYILYEFGNKLQEAYKGHTAKLREDKNRPWEASMLLVIYLLFILMYLSLITQVLTPIVLDLCIYK